MHNHCLISYNDKFIFKNIECNQHLLRDIKKNTDNTLPKTRRWSEQLMELISETIHHRNQGEHVRDDGSGFIPEYINEFRSKVDKLLLQGEDENQKLPESCWYRNKELSVINHIRKFFDIYFMWLGDFSFPIANNLSEGSLRGIKVKRKISRQFKNINYAGYFVALGSYLETCRRNNINEFHTLERLCEVLKTDRQQSVSH